MTISRILSAAGLGAVLLTTTLSAQTASVTTDANRFIPQNSSVVLRIASPAKWRARFGESNAAKLMSAETLAPLMAGLTQNMEQGMQQLRDNGMFDVALLEGLLDDWQGDLVIALQVDLEGVMEAIQFGDVPKISFVVALTPDGKFDLAALAAELEQQVEKTKPDGVTLRDLPVGDLTLRCSDNGGEEPDVALPTMIDGHLVMVGGMDLERDAARLLGKDDRLTAKTDGSPLFLQVDLGSIMQAAMAAMGEGAGPVDPSDIFEKLGLGSFRAMTMRLDADGEHVVGDMEVGLAEERRGLMRMLEPSQQAPRLLRSVPADSEAFSVTTMAIEPIYDTIRDLWIAMDDMLPMKFDDAMQGFTEATKIRLKEDLIDHLGSELLVVQDVEALQSADVDDLEDNPAAMLSGAVYGIALRDGKAFGESLETMLRSRGMHVGRKREDYGNIQVNSLRLAGLVEIEYVVADDVLLIGVGGNEGTQRALRSVLDTRADGTGGMPDVIEKHGAALPPGWSGVTVTPIAATLQGIVAAMEASGEMPPEMGMATAIARGICQDMKRLGIETMISVSYIDTKSIRSRFRW